MPLPARLLEPVYAGALKLRGGLMRLHLPRRLRVSVPVVVVGNATVGGTGKTPLTIELVQRLREAGWNPGVASRGYGRKAEASARWVDAQTPPIECAAFAPEQAYSVPIDAELPEAFWIALFARLARLTTKAPSPAKR